MEEFSIILSTTLYGVRDCLYGCYNACRIRDIEDQLATSDTSSCDIVKHKCEAPAHQSTLAKRRAASLKYKDRTKDSKPKLNQRIMLCCAWNGGVFLFSILLFDFIILPMLQLTFSFLFHADNSGYAWSTVKPLLSWTFSALWVFPLFILSKLTNCFWFNDIAEAAYRRGSRQVQSLPSFGKMISDILFSLLLQALFLVQASILAFLIPIAWFSSLVYLLHMAIIYAMYAFEYKWFNMGWEVEQRVDYIQHNWPYFIGFGLPLALLTSCVDYVVGGCIFSILFPLLIVAGHEAKVVEVKRIKVRMFLPVIVVCDLIFTKGVRISHRWKAVGQTSRAYPPPPHQRH